MGQRNLIHRRTPKKLMRSKEPAFAAKWGAGTGIGTGTGTGKSSWPLASQPSGGQGHPRYRSSLISVVVIGEWLVAGVWHWRVVGTEGGQMSSTSTTSAAQVIAQTKSQAQKQQWAVEMAKQVA